MVANERGNDKTGLERFRMNTMSSNENKTNEDAELINGLEVVLKIKEIHNTLDDCRYPSVHLKLILSKILLEHFKGDVHKVKIFLSKYDQRLNELTEALDY